MKKHFEIIFLIVALAMTVSCAMESKTTNNPVLDATTGVPYAPVTVAPGYDPGYLYGGSVTLAIESVGVMSDYTKRIMNNPQNIMLNMNMTKTSGGTFGGTATISYTDGPYAYKGYFTAGHSAEATKYNRAFTWNGKQVWHGVFEDYMGGLVVVIDEVVDLGDGMGSQDTVSGTVWYWNFNDTYAPHPPTYCWFVYYSPRNYDCRPWPSGNTVNTYADKNPGAGYVKLGSFTGLSLKKAFNGQTLQ